MNPPLPEVSIILPTCNRADTVMRAVGSVLAQTFQDWELIVIDDGSTDSTPQLNLDVDSRIRLIRQHNQGVAAARNAGIAVSKGHLIAFLDSDDEWLPHFLELSVGFLRASSEDQYVTLEFLEDDTDRRVLKHRILNTYLPEAQMIGSDALDLPPGESDDYLRVFQSRQRLGAWATHCLSGASRDYLYRGNIFRYWRWGYFAWLPTTVLTRHAMEVVGRFDTSRRSAEDYPFQVLLARQFRTNFISVPSARKHEHGLYGTALNEDHLATGSNSFSFRINRLHYFDELHLGHGRGDPELSMVRRHYAYDTACVALASGFRSKSVSLFKEAACFRKRLWRAYPLCALAASCPSDRTAASVYGAFSRLWRVRQRLSMRG